MPQRTWGRMWVTQNSKVCGTRLQPWLDWVPLAIPVIPCEWRHRTERFWQVIEKWGERIFRGRGTVESALHDQGGAGYLRRMGRGRSHAGRMRPSRGCMMHNVVGDGGWTSSIRRVVSARLGLENWFQSRDVFTRGCWAQHLCSWSSTSSARRVRARFLRFCPGAW